MLFQLLHDKTEREGEKDYQTLKEKGEDEYFLIVVGNFLLFGTPFVCVEEERYTFHSIPPTSFYKAISRRSSENKKLPLFRTPFPKLLLNRHSNDDSEWKEGIEL